MQTTHIDNTLSLPPPLISSDIPPLPEASRELSLETQVFLNYHYGSRNRRKLLKTVFRANVILKNQLTDKTRILSLKAVEVANAILHKLVNGNKALFNHEYISKITKCDTSKQNNNIIAQLTNLFDVIHHNFIHQNGKVLRHNVEFKIKASVLDEAKDSGALNSEFYWKKISSPNTNSIFSNRNNRSSAGAQESNVLLNSNNIIPSSDTENITDASVEKIVAEDVDTPVKPKADVVQKLRNCPPKNQRKKPTNAEKQARVLKFRQYQKPKTLADMHPLLDQAMYNELRSESGRDFCNTFIEQTVLKMSKKSDITATFNYQKGFISYMGDALKWELHDAVKTNNINFHYKQNKTSAEIAEYTSISDRDNYFNEVETRAYTNRTDESQYRAKLVGTMKPWQAYNFLSNLKTVRKVGEVFEIFMAKEVELTPYSLKMLLQEANAVGGFCGVDELEIIV